MKLKDALKRIIVLFFVITICITLFMSLLPVFTGSDFDIAARDLYRIPLVALLGAIPVFVLIRNEKASNLEIVLRKILHFVLTSALVLGSLMLFGWIDAASAAVIVVFFLVVYIVIWIVETVRGKKLAARLNERINAFQSDENATHSDKP